MLRLRIDDMIGMENGCVGGEKRSGDLVFKKQGRDGCSWRRYLFPDIRAAGGVQE